MPGAMPNNNAPWWGPGRPLIVADPDKLTFFARANAIRTGIVPPWGAYGVGLGDVNASDFSDEGGSRAFVSASQFDRSGSDPNGTVTGGRIVPTSVATSYGFDPEILYNDATPSRGAETANDTATVDGTKTVGAFFDSINKLLRSPAPNPYGQPPSAQPSPWPWVIGVGVVGIGLIALTKRRRG